MVLWNMSMQKKKKKHNKKPNTQLESNRNHSQSKAAFHNRPSLTHSKSVLGSYYAMVTFFFSKGKSLSISSRDCIIIVIRFLIAHHLSWSISRMWYFCLRNELIWHKTRLYWDELLIFQLLMKTLSLFICSIRSIK